MEPRRRAIAAGISLAGVGVVVLLGPRYRFEERWIEPAIGVDVERYLADREAGVANIRPGEEKAVLWADSSSKRATPVALVYLHGFSADRHEIDPVVQRLASELGANTYFPRLRGHGRDGPAMAEATVEAWMDDTVEAIAVGRVLGDRVVLVGTSTGGTLAVWAATRDEVGDALAALVLISPNFHPRDRRTRVLLWPWGGLIARAVQGAQRCFETESEAQARHWTTCYPTSALLPMMALVEHVRTMALERLRVPLVLLYSRDDLVVDASETRGLFPRFASFPKRLIRVHGSTDPSQHLLAGDIMAPESTELVVTHVLEFLRPVVGTAPAGNQ